VACNRCKLLADISSILEIPGKTHAFSSFIEQSKCFEKTLCEIGISVY